MEKQERERIKRRIKRSEKLGALKFQKIVFQVEKIKFKVIKKLCPNFIKYYDSYCDYHKKKQLKHAKTEQEKKAIVEEAKFLKMAMRKEMHQEKNRNYHLDEKKPTEMKYYLEWNKKVHQKGLVKNAVCIPVLTAATIAGFPIAIPFLALEVISTGINLECINIQNYNLSRFQLIEEQLKRKEERTTRENIEKYGEASKAIYQSMEKKGDLPTFDEVIEEANSKEKLRQMKALLQKEIEARKMSTNRGEEHVRIKSNNH